MHLALGAAGVAAVILFLAIWRDVREHGAGASAGFFFVWMAAALIGLLRGRVIDVPPEQFVLGLATVWFSAALVTAGHPSDWMLLMDRYYGTTTEDDTDDDELSRRQKWNLSFSPWVLILIVGAYVAGVTASLPS